MVLVNLDPPVHWDLLETPDQQVRLDLEDLLVYQETQGTQDVPELAAHRDPRVHKVHLDRRALMVSPGQLVSQEVKVSLDSQERQEMLELLVNQATPVRTGRRDSRVPLALRVSRDQEETLGALDHKDLLELMVHWVL